MPHLDSASYSSTTPDYVRTTERATYIPRYVPQYSNSPPLAPFPNIEYMYPLFIIAYLLSIVSLILSIIVFARLPEYKNKITGKILVTMSLCFLTGYVSLCMDMAVRNVVSPSSCFTLAVIIHFSFLGFFLWTSILAFDFYLLFTRIIYDTYEENEKYWKRYIVYSIVAWIGTLGAALPAYILDGNETIAPVFRPYFGIKRCWVTGIDAFTFYFNSPVGIIVLINSFLYVQTMRRIYSIDHLIAYLQAQPEQKRLNSFFRLFFLMGIIWFIEFLQFMSHKDWLHIVAELIIALYGVFFCAIFVLNRRIRRKIKEHFFGIVTAKEDPLPNRPAGPISMYPLNSDHPLANEVFMPRNNVFGEQRF